MRRVVISFLVVLGTCLSYGDETCKYGLGRTYGAETCFSREQLALRRVAAAKTICMSANSEIQWNKNNKEPSWAWGAIQAGEFVAIKGFAVTGCEDAALVVKYLYDDAFQSVTMTVTDAESGAKVYEEIRNVADLRSDAVRIARHWQEMVSDARASAVAARAEAERAESERQRQAALEEESHRCETEFDSLKQNIIAYTQIQHVSLPQSIQDQIARHNETCANRISPEILAAQAKAENDGRIAQEKAARELAVREQYVAQLEKSKGDALAVWKQRLIDAPFTPPVESWTHEAGLGYARYYIILPETGFDPNCRFTVDGSSPALDCLGKAGRNDYVSVLNNGHWYLLRTKRIKSGDHAATVKDRGRTLCLRDVGCYRVLAELRQEPSELPDLLHVPVPSSAMVTYSGNDVTFSYPQNWRVDERKDKDGVVAQVNVAPPEAHLSSWVTHGLFVGHVGKASSQVPATLDGAYEQFASVQRQRGFVLTSPATTPLGDSAGKMATYTSSSIFKAGESGWIAVVKDKSDDGYYWIEMFYPSNDDGHLYALTFVEILKSFRFKK